MSIESKYALGLDYGTNSCRCLLVNLTTGKEIASSVFSYPSGEQGILLDKRDPHVARQNPNDYIEALEVSIPDTLKQAKAIDSDFDAKNIIGLGVDTTGSTIIPVNKKGEPLALLPEFKDNLNAHTWLWKDHSSYEEAEHITSKAKTMRPQYLEACGGAYSSEWFWSKILHLKHIDMDVYNASFSFVEHCDFIPALLTANTDPLSLPRGVCAAAHKAMYSSKWGGLPDAEFLNAVEPGLAELRDRLYENALPAGVSAGMLSEEWAKKLGLTTNVSVSVGAFDAHLGAVGSGVNEGTLVKIIGTSCCDLMVAPMSKGEYNVPGVCGVAEESVIAGFWGIEAGQSAVGDIFNWFVSQMVPEKYGSSAGEKFSNLEKQASQLKPGESGLMALDWNNGNRSLLTDTQLSGLLLGQTLHTQAHEVYRTLIEATAFGALAIVNQLENCGVEVKEIVTCGGIPEKSPMLMQIYADVMGRPLKIAKSAQTCALGAAIMGAYSAGDYSLDDLQASLCHMKEDVYTPIPENHQMYQELFSIYMKLHDSFGTKKPSISLYSVMKDLISIREKQREASHVSVS